MFDGLKLLKTGATLQRINRAGPLSAVVSESDPNGHATKLEHLEHVNEMAAAWIIVVVLAALFVGVEWSLFSGTAVPRRMEPAEEGPVHRVSLLHHAFVPSLVTVHPGDRIDWENVDEDVHALTVVDHEEILQDEVIEPRSSLSFIVPTDMQPGEYIAICTIHSDMRVGIVVTDIKEAPGDNQNNR